MKELKVGQRLSEEEVLARIYEAIDDLDFSDMAELHNNVTKGVIECVDTQDELRIMHNPYVVMEEKSVQGRAEELAERAMMALKELRDLAEKA